MRVSDLIVVTKGRPAMLERCFASYAANGARFRGESPAPVAVLDDSEGGNGAMERARLHRRLLDFLGDDYRAVLDYALLTPSIGAARNVVQLLNVGRWYATADDDTVAKAIYTGRGGQMTDAPLAISLRHDPTSLVQVGAHADVSTRAASMLGAEEVDVLAPLEALLAAGAWVSQLGQAGDCAMGRPVAYGLMTREVLRGAVHWVLSRGAHFMAVCSAYDGTRDLPPFYPVGRGEDAVFGQLLAQRGALIGHAPYAIVHDPDDERALVDEPPRPSDTWFEDELFMRTAEAWPAIRLAAEAGF